MSQLKSRVGRWKLNWSSMPRGREGVAQVEVESSGQKLEVRWRRDGDGLWILFPHGIFGFDFKGEMDESGKPVFQITQRGTSSEWIGVSSSRGDESIDQATRGSKAKATRIRAQMPGKVIRIMVEAGQQVQKDQPVLVMEAMKMENEIRSTQAGKVSQIKASVGQAVETGADLILLDPV